MFFDPWQGLARVILVGVPAYLVLVLVLRVSGKRTLSKMNAFDLVVTVAFGSTLASILTSSEVALAEGVLALALLVALQFVVAWSAARSRLVDRLVKADPAMLCYRGDLLPGTMRRERVTRGEVLAAVRQAGFARMDEAEAVVLETDGAISVIPRQERPATTLEDVGAPEEVPV